MATDFEAARRGSVFAVATARNFCQN